MTSYLAGDRLFLKVVSKQKQRIKCLLTGVITAYNLNKFHDRNRIEEVQATKTIQPVSGTGNFSNR